MNHDAQARAVLERRAAIINDAKNRGDGLTDAEEREVQALEDDARAIIEKGQREDRASELFGKAGAIVTPSPDHPGAPQYRGLLPSYAEYRATLVESGNGAAAVPAGTAATLIDKLAAQSVVLRALPGANVIRFTEGSLTLPMLGSSTDAGYVTEAQTIPDGDATLTGLTFDPVKLADLRWASNEVLSDSAVDLRNILAQDMIRNCAVKADAELLNAPGNAGELHGIIPQGTSTTLTAAVSYDDVSGAIEAIQAANGNATHILVAPDVAAGLREAKTTGSGEYLAGSPVASPANTSWGLTMLVSGNVPSKNAVILDASRVFVGVRTDPVVKLDESARFADDVVGLRLRYRLSGAAVAETSSVQVLVGG